MAAHTLITTVSRRSMLAGGSAFLAVTPAVVLSALPAGGGDARVTALAAEYRRATDDLVDWINETERRHGPCAYDDRPEYKGRYDALTIRLDRVAAALALARPDSIRGLAIKVRAACCFGALLPDFDTRLLVPAVADLERLAALDTA